MPEKTLLPYRLHVTVCWIDETASNLVPFSAIFSLGNKKKSAGTKSGEWGGWENTGDKKI
jgi:hypothetical protein